MTVSSIETLEDIKRKVVADVEKGIIPSVSIAVAKDGEVIWQEAFGWADKAEKRVATPETIYSLASLTKPLTATGVMLLAEQGKIDLDESIEKYVSPLTLKSYAYDSGKVTVRHLLHHTSGLPTHFNYFYADEEASPPSFEETLDRYGFTVNEPGTSFRYSNLGYGLLGFAMSQISQVPFAGFMENEVFVPLGMNRTMFHIESCTKKNVAIGYDSEGNALPGMQCDTPGAGSAYSTSGDMMRFALCLPGNGLTGSESILSENSITRMISERSGSSRVPYLEDAYYCLGFFSRQPKGGLAEVWHEGGWDGASSLLKVIPEENLAVVTLTNTYNSEYVTGITNRIVAAMLGLDKEEERELPSRGRERAPVRTDEKRKTKNARRTGWNLERGNQNLCGFYPNDDAFCAGWQDKCISGGSNRVGRNRLGSASPHRINGFVGSWYL
jgi:CubicO group peptidase (beta-lactamase class C family)